MPVIQGKQVVGMVTDRDIRRVSAPDSSTLSIYELNYLLDKIQVSQFMTKKVFTVDPDEPIEVAAKQIYDHKIGSLADAAKIIKDLGLYLVSVVTLPKTEGLTRSPVFRVQPTDLKKLKEQLSAAGPPIVAVHD